MLGMGLAGGLLGLFGRRAKDGQPALANATGSQTIYLPMIAAAPCTTPSTCGDRQYCSAEEKCIAFARLRAIFAAGRSRPHATFSVVVPARNAPILAAAIFVTRLAAAAATINHRGAASLRAARLRLRVHRRRSAAQHAAMRVRAVSAAHAARLIGCAARRAARADKRARTASVSPIFLAMLRPRNRSTRRAWRWRVARPRSR